MAHYTYTPKAFNITDRTRVLKKSVILFCSLFIVIHWSLLLNEIYTLISVSQDGGNLVPRVCVTLDQQSGNEDSGNEIKDGRHFGLNLNHTGMERVVFILRLRLRCLGSQVWNANACKHKCKRKEMKHFRFLMLALALVFALVLW